jgi:plasmid stabilization system protein ParE
MKKLLGLVALAGAAYAGLAAYASQQGREVGDVAGDLLNRGTEAAERAADRLMAFAESLTDEPAGVEGDDVVVDVRDELPDQPPVAEGLQA